MTPTGTTDSVPPPGESYKDLIHRPLNQLALIGPLLILLHVGSERIGDTLLVPEYLQIFLQWILGDIGRHLTAGLIVAVLIGQHLARKDPLRVNLWATGGMVVESGLWATPLLAAGWLTASAAQAMQGNAPPGLLQEILVSIGAGIYEEFLFRLAGIGVLMLLAVDLLGASKRRILPAAIGIMAVFFALCHFTTSQLTGVDPFPWERAIFFTLAGCWWGVLLVWRGFGVAVASHILWDLLVLALR